MINIGNIMDANPVGDGERFIPQNFDYIPPLQFGCRLVQCNPQQLASASAQCYAKIDCVFDF